MTVQTESLAGIDLRAEIDRLRKERNAVILAHYYQKPGAPGPGRFRRRRWNCRARRPATDADVIAFCGVKFMADTAKILSPEKIVVLPDWTPGAALRIQLPAGQVQGLPRGAPDHIALTYINCSTEVKALSDVIVTSLQRRDDPQPDPARTEDHLRPDRHLGGYLNRKFGREMLLWPGVCIVHEAFSETELLKLKAQHPRRARRRAPGMPAAHHRPCRLCRLDQRHPELRQDLPRRHPDRRDRAAHHPPDGKGAAGQDLHRRARRGRQLQLQHLPLHGAQHAGEALRRAARPEPRIEIEEGAAPRRQEEPRPDAGHGQRDRRQGRSGKLAKVAASGADVVVVDLEDAVAPHAKQHARDLARQWLEAHRQQVLAGGGFRRWVRINPLGGSLWRDDLYMVMRGQPDGIVVPKVGNAEQLRMLAAELYELEQMHRMQPGSTRILPMLGETPQSALTIAEFATLDLPRLAGLTWGAEDLAAAVGASRKRDEAGQWTDLFRMVRSQVLLAAHARQLAPVDTVHAAYKDIPALKAIAAASFADGFAGMLAIHPDQVPVINAAFTPSAEQLAEARAIVELFATSPGAGALAMGGRMVETPHLARAKALLERTG
jgi:citrate lyase subunit beta / citryl-CoA lyase